MEHLPSNAAHWSETTKDITMFHWLPQTLTATVLVFMLLGVCWGPVYLFAGCPEFPLKKIQFHLNTHSWKRETQQYEAVYCHCAKKVSSSIQFQLNLASFRNSMNFYTCVELTEVSLSCFLRAAQIPLKLYRAFWSCLHYLELPSNTKRAAGSKLNGRECGVWMTSTAGDAKKQQSWLTKFARHPQNNTSYSQKSLIHLTVFIVYTCLKTIHTLMKVDH